MTGENVILSAAKNLSPLRGEEFFPGIVKDALPFLLYIIPKWIY